MRCLTCKYDLRQLTEHRCPECGREFDPKNDRTFFDLIPLTLPERMMCNAALLAVVSVSIGFFIAMCVALLSAF